MTDSMEQYNHINQTDLSTRLLKIDSELETEDIKSLKFLCYDDIPVRTLERVEDGIQIFSELEKIGKIDTSCGDMDYLLESFYRCHRLDLINKMGFNKNQVKQRVLHERSNFSPFRILLFEIAEEMETTDLKTALFTLSPIIPRSKHERITSLYDVFIFLERTGELSPVRTDVLMKLLKMLDRSDLVTKVRTYQGAMPTGYNTEPGYGPVDEGEPVRQYGVEIALAPVGQGEGQISLPSPIESRVPDPRVHSVHFTGNQLPFTNQFQNVGPSQQNIVYISPQGQNNSRSHNAHMSEEVRQRIKEEDRNRDSIRVVPSRPIDNDPMSRHAQQEHPSIESVSSPTPQNPTGPSERTGFDNRAPVNHLVPRNDVVVEEQSPELSGLTAGTLSPGNSGMTVSLSDQSTSCTSSGDVKLSITESKLVPLSEIVATHSNCDGLAFNLGISSEVISKIITSSPTLQIRVHGYMKHWFIEEMNKTGTSPNAEILLKAFQKSGFNDAIQEFVRLSQESESSAVSENIQVQTEQNENYSVYSGEARVDREDMDVQGPTAYVDFSSSGAQVGPSLNPSINRSQRQPGRQDEEVMRQMEAVAIDDTGMPFYKMDARPRGLAIIINNQHFYKVQGDSQSREMPSRTGTEKDAEKLDYIWRKLHFEVRQFNDVDSTRMNQLMVEISLNTDHSSYDCFVCCILSHGVLGHVYGCDGRIVRIPQLTRCFSSSRCPSLAGKPKMFFIQACQGRDKQEGHMIETDAAGSMAMDVAPTEIVEPDRPRELIPDEADFLLGYATVPGYVSYRSRSQGSWYINKLAQNLDKYAYQHDLLSILIKVNEEVGKATANIDNGIYKQIPAPMFTLRKRIIFR